MPGGGVKVSTPRAQSAAQTETPKELVRSQCRLDALGNSKFFPGIEQTDRGAIDGIDGW